jgi:hypothetical protein
VAVDFETGNVFVADSGNNRIDIFEENGTKPATPPSFPLTNPTWIAVDNVAASPSQHDIYLVTGFSVKKFSPTGTLLDEFGEQGDGTPEPCQLERSNDPLAVGPSGVVYLADSYELPSGEFTNRIVKFDAAGACVGEVALFEGPNQTIRDLAVDSVGSIYVTVSGGGGFVRKYDPTGTLLQEFEFETSGLAVDEADHLFARQRVRGGNFLTEYASDGSILRRFNYASGNLPGFVGLAAHHSADGDVFVSDPSGVKYVSLPAPGPVVFPEPCQVKNNAPGSFRATLQVAVNPEGKATTLKAEYLTQDEWEAGKFSNPGVKTAEAPLGGSADFELHEGTVAVEPLEPETTYHCRILATNADGSATGEEGSFKTGPRFLFGPAWSAEVGTTTATIFAEGNPEGAAATGQIEYVSDAQYQANGFAGAQLSTPPLEYGSGETMVLGLDEEGDPAHLAGLQPGTLYHYRLRAFNAGAPGGIVCPAEAASCPALEHTFRTYASSEAKADNRGYELVSPGEKNSAEIGGPPNGRGIIEPRSSLVFAAAPSGEEVTYTSWTSFGQAQGAPATSQYLSNRNPASGWETQNISPRGFQGTQLPGVVVPPYLGFSYDLRFAAVRAREVSLAPGCPAEEINLYLREPSGALSCLTPEAPSLSGEPIPTFGGVNEDGSRAFFRAFAPYAGALGGQLFRLYETHEGQIHPVNVLPGQTQPPSTGSSIFGAALFGDDGSETGLSIIRHAISADGSHAIWSYMLPYSGTGKGPNELFDRINGTETIQLDAKQSGSGASGEGLYWAASKDGSVVYFTSPNKLISNAQAKPGAEDLYRYDFNASPPLSDLTSGGTAKGLVPGDVQGVLGASDDGSKIYFVAQAALPNTEANAAGQEAQAGKNNLYLYDSGEGTMTFIAQLSPEDNGDWETQPKSQTARVTPDGEHLAFLSVEAKALAGYDNTLEKSGGLFGAGEHCRLNPILNTTFGSSACPEAFLYEAATKALRCASCNPSGARPLGPATLPFWTNMAEGPRYLSDDGSRFFFESFDRLLPSDESPKRDIYEFELPGPGSCSAANPNYDPVSGGCLFLVSSGRSSDENHLIDASTDGQDVFFTTRDRLTPGLDPNENYDLYDYREGGGFPERAEAIPCGSLESCKPPATPSPPTPTPATPNNANPGNPAPPKPKHHKKKHKQKKKNAKHHKKKGKAKKHAKKNGRAAR